jgi:hypothetical protein
MPALPGYLRDAVLGAAGFALCVLGLAGWFLNIAAIWSSSSVTGATLLRIVGIPFWPIGAVLGWF